MSDALGFALPDDRSRASCTALAERLRQQEARVADLTEDLRVALATLKDLAERELPEAMGAIGQSEFRLTDGTRVSLNHKLIGTKVTDPKALAWVEDHDGAPLINANVVVKLTAKDLDLARELQTFLRNHPRANSFQVSLDLSVHQSSIGPFAREQNATADELELLGVTRRTTAKVGAHSLYKPLELKGLERKSSLTTANGEDE
jgi:hypothetical protein